MSHDVPNSFIWTLTPNGNERVIMNIKGVLVYLIVEMDPAFYGKYVVYENRRKFLYVEVIQVMYVMLVASLLCYKNFHSYLEDISF